jgi:hypothetical protein
MQISKNYPAKDNVKEFSRMAVSNAKTFEQIVAGEYVKHRTNLEQELLQKESQKT